MATKIVVVVPQRPPHPGFWCHGKFYPTGKNEVEVTDEQLAELKADEARGFLSLVEPLKPAEPPTLDELYAMVEKAEADAEKLKLQAAEAEKAAGKVKK